VKRRRPCPGPNIFDKFSWVTVRRCGQNLNRFSSSSRVKPGPVAAVNLRADWSLNFRISNQARRRQTYKESRELIFWLVRENPTVGAQCIRGFSAQTEFFRTAPLGERNTQTDWRRGQSRANYSPAKNRETYREKYVLRASFSAWYGRIQLRCLQLQARFRIHPAIRTGNYREPNRDSTALT
jgi:hypothetical protein